MNGLADNDDIMKKKDADLNKLKGEKLADCIIDDPEIIFKCDTRNITTQGWVDILCQHPDRHRRASERGQIHAF